MGIHLREKEMANGQVSLYLDIYHNKKRWYEFLDIHISKSKLTEQEREKRLYAQQIKIQRENQLIVEGNGLINKGKQKADFFAWFDEYGKAKPCYRHYRITLLHMKEFQGNKPLSFQTLTPEWIKSFIAHLKTWMHNNTIRHYLKTLNSALKDAEDQDIIRKNPMRFVDRKNLVKKLDTYRKAFTFEELQILIDAPCNVEPQYKHAYLFGCFTGLRWGDVNALKWSQIIVKKIQGEERYFVHFQQDKTKAIEYFPLSDQAINILKLRKKESEWEPQSIYVFPLVKEHTKSGSKLSTVNAALKKWAKAAGLNPKEIHFHTSRHTFATNVLEQATEGDLYTVSKLLGHKTISATQIYAKVRDQRKFDAIKALPTLNLSELNPNVSQAS